MANFYEDDDPGEMPPEGYTGEDGPPDQYVPLDEMSRNRLMPNIHLAGFGGGGGRRAARSDNSFEIEQYLRGLSQTPEGGTDAGIAEIMGLAHQYGVRTPYDRAFNEPPAARAPAFGPSGKPRPLMRGQDDYKDERGGRGAFWDDNDPSVYEPEYQARYGRR
jgi:hypothetical protein